MGNILNIIDSRNHHKKTDGLIPLQHGAFFTQEFDNSFEYKFHNLKYISKANNYFYIVEIAHDFGIIDAMNDILQMDKLIKLINNDKCKVILAYESEGDLDMSEFNDWYLEVCKPAESQVKFSNFYIFHSDLNCKKNNKTKINFYPSVYFLESTSHSLNNIISHEGGIQKTEMDYDFQYKTIQDIDIDKKTKHFLSFMRGMHNHRIALASYFEHNDLWYDNIISFLKIQWDYTGVIPEMLPEKYWESANKLGNREAVEIDTQNLKNKGGFSTMFTSKWEFYEETFLSVVSETIYDNDKLYFTEKICKPLMCLHPFILVTSPHSLKRLQKFGFKTFHPFIDESYDSEENGMKRMQMIFDELDKFRARPIQELKDWWKEILPILEHNQKVFLKLGKNKSKRIKYMEKLND